jgi:hypothetical protein
MKQEIFQLVAENVITNVEIAKTNLQTVLLVPIKIGLNFQDVLVVMGGLTIVLLLVNNVCIPA